jgi:phosphate-selective porin OprO/OprP
MRLSSIALNLTAAAFSLAVPLLANAGDASAASSGKAVASTAVSPKAASAYDKIWSNATLYKDKDAFIQEFSLTGRAQFEYYNVSADQGSTDDWATRRLRGGFKMKFADHWLLHAEANFDAQNPNPFYTKLTDALLQYTASDEFVLTLGKQSVKFGLDGGTSSKELITIDRSNLANNLWFTEEYAPGVSVGGKSGKWNYFVGGFSSDGNPEFGDFAAGNFLLTRLGYNFAEDLHSDTAMLWLDYVYQTPDDGNTATRPFENIGSVNFNYGKGKWGIGADVKGGTGYGKQGDIFGVQVMPSYFITDKVQAVLRYTHMNGDDNAIRLARYENRVVDGKGDQYNEYYAGLNYYLYGHKLKFQTGVQYATLSDSKNDGGEYGGWQVVSGVRISW